MIKRSMGTLREFREGCLWLIIPFAPFARGDKCLGLGRLKLWRLLGGLMWLGTLIDLQNICANIAAVRTGTKVGTRVQQLQILKVDNAR